MSKLKSAFFILIVIISLLPILPVYSQESDEEIQAKIEEYTKKISDLSDKADTLSSELEYMNTQIQLTELKIRNSLDNISKTEGKIENLTTEIDDLKNRISKLSDSINYQRLVLNSRSRERYKSGNTDPILALFGSITFNSLVQKVEYLQQMEVQDKKMLDEMESTKKSYDNQRNIFEDKRKEEEDLKKQLVDEKASLDAYKGDLSSQKLEKSSLLEATQNDENRYSALLEEARRKLSSFNDYTTNAGGGVIGPNGLGSGKDGWYYSQRDSRWANTKIGRSNYIIFNVGCLVTSVAMVHKYYGYSVTPATVASWNSRFISGDMLMPWPAPGNKKYTSIYTSGSSIDAELHRGNPVIVGVRANNSVGTHFVVLIKDTGNDWKMYDPWNGPDLDFGDYYSYGSIFHAAVFK